MRKRRHLIYFPSRLYMWCEHCRQDVTAIAADDAHIVCGRCQRPIEAKPEDPPSLRINTLRLQEDLHTIDRIVGRLGRDVAHTEQEKVSPPSPAPQQSSPVRSSAARPNGRKLKAPRLPIFSWLATSLGSILLVCGVVLLSWALFDSRPILSAAGLPLAIVGLASMLVGLVFQLDCVSQHNRRLHRHLLSLEHELEDLQSTTRLMRSSHSSASQNFYLHMAEGASPHVLLADVKGQLDLLATQMAEERRR